MTIYYVELTTSVVDGSAYTANDIIVIRAGARGGLKFQNFNGNGRYITITNEQTTPSTKVEINGMSGRGCLSIFNCKYIDLRGNNDLNLEYGIKVINGNISQTAGTVWVYGESDHIKLSYLEATCEGNPSISGNGIFVQDGNLSKLWTWDTFDIHHNYIHNTRYAGMYLGQNDPGYYDNPYIARVTVHDNIVEVVGTYGMVLKGLNGGPNYIYNNTVDTTGVVSRPDIPSDSFRTGIRLRTYTSAYSIDVYDNFVINTKGPGILAGEGSHNIYNNIICNAGTNNSFDWGHGIEFFLGVDGAHVYDNIIIHPKRYGIYNKSSAIDGVTMYRNLIGDAGLGEWAEVRPGGTVEGTGVNANIYHQDVAAFGFRKWTDDGDYSNDDFTIGDICDGVICENVCVGNDLWSQKCNISTGLCVSDQLIESNSIQCDQDPCAGVVCGNICIGKDLYSQKCEGGVCVIDQLIESNSVTCDLGLCEGVICPNICAGNDLWSQTCDTDTGACVLDKLLQQDAINCVIPDRIPTDDSTIQTYLVLGGIGLAGLAILMMGIKR